MDSKTASSRRRAVSESPHRAELIARRALIVCVSLSVLGTFAGVVLARSTSPTAAVPAWYMAPVIVTLAVLIVPGAVVVWLPLSALRVVSGFGAGCYIVMLAGFGPALAVIDPGVGSVALPWALAVYAGPALAAVVAAGEGAGLVVAAASMCTVPIYRLALGTGDALGPAVSDVQTALCALAVCVVGGALVRGSIRVDALAARAGEASVREAEIRGRVAARARSAAFVHDEVLVALRAAAEGGAIAQAAIQRQARRALMLADRFHSGMSADAGTRSDDLWLDEIRRCALDVDPRIRVEVSASVQPVSVPGDVAEALVRAARQALDNSVHHAGPAARALRIEQSGDRVVVDVSDDGTGFEPGKLPPGRLGIGMSIVEAMRTVGGRARVQSAPGSGTRVVLEWQRATVPDVAQHEGESLDLPTAVQAFEDARFGRGLRALTIMFFASQAVIAGIVGVSAGQMAVSVGVLVALAASGILIVRARGRGRTAGALVTVLPVAAGLTGIALNPAPAGYEQVWFLPAVGLLLGAIALRAHPLAATIGTVGLLAGAILITSLAGSHSVALALATARTVLIVSLAILIALVIQRARDLSVRASERAVSAIRASARDAAAQREIERRASDLDVHARPVLERLAAGEVLSPADRSFAGAVEGRLRDGYRAHALSREPLVDAVMDARRRGVDVVLLDDSEDAEYADEVCAAIADWMTPYVEQALERFVGRLLPPGRTLVARAVVDGQTAGYPARGEWGAR